MICKRFHPPACPDLVYTGDWLSTSFTSDFHLLHPVKVYGCSCMISQKFSWCECLCCHVTFAGHMKLWPVTIKDKVWRYQQFLIDMKVMVIRIIWSFRRNGELTLCRVGDEKVLQVTSNSRRKLAAMSLRTSFPSSWSLSQRLGSNLSESQPCSMVILTVPLRNATSEVDGRRVLFRLIDNTVVFIQGPDTVLVSSTVHITVQHSNHYTMSLE